MSDEILRRLERAKAAAKIACGSDQIADERFAAALRRVWGQEPGKLSPELQKELVARADAIGATVIPTPVLNGSAFCLFDSRNRTVFVPGEWFCKDSPQNASPGSPDRSLPNGLASSSLDPSDESTRP